MLKQLTPNIMTSDIEETVKYYTEILGFELLNSVENEGVLEWMHLKFDDINLMFETDASLCKGIPEFIAQTPSFTGVFYIEVTNISDYYNRIHNMVEMVEDLHEMPYGMKEFMIRDNNGYYIVFAESR